MFSINFRSNSKLYWYLDDYLRLQIGASADQVQSSKHFLYATPTNL